MIRFNKQIKQKWKSQKIPKDFNKIPGSKILGNPVPKNPGIEILDPARAWPQLHQLQQGTLQCRQVYHSKKCSAKYNAAVSAVSNVQLCPHVCNGLISCQLPVQVHCKLVSALVSVQCEMLDYTVRLAGDWDSVTTAPCTKCTVHNAHNSLWWSMMIITAPPPSWSSLYKISPLNTGGGYLFAKDRLLNNKMLLTKH